jgi:hypothetical protein
MTIQELNDLITRGGAACSIPSTSAVCLMGSEEHPSTLPSWKNSEGFGGANHRREATAEK